MSNRFVFIACHYNMSKTVGQMLMSIGAQSYKNWKVIITDDVSSTYEKHDTLVKVSKFRELIDGSERTGAGAHKSPCVEYIMNTEKKWETENVLTMIRTWCNPDDIVCRIDCDDYLCDNDALWAINEAYEYHNCDALWTAHRWIDEGDVPTTINISGPLQGTDVYKSPWVSSHLKTFRASMLDGINEENFKIEDGTYGKTAGDQALYLPILHKAKKKMYFPFVAYAYRCSLEPSHFYTDTAYEQQKQAEFFRKRGFVE